ncbi:MAG: MarR family transcriptional regulator [Planctomycetes bacterium]|nr:MarR family transcriptional regulator [Planctomycetota bacterium]
MNPTDAVDITKTLAIAYRRLLLLYSHELQSIGVKAGHMMYLCCICDNPGFSQDEISAHLHVDKSTVAKAVKELLREGYITRAPNPEFRREYAIMPTEKGRRTRILIEEIKQRGHVFITSQMTDIERELFLMLLRKLPQ